MEKKNGYCAEYNYEGGLVFKGEYLDGNRWNGKTYKYIKSKIIDIFVIKKGIGYGVEYHDNGELKFDGEYMNGDKWNGKEYDDRGYLDAKYTYGKREHLGCYII